jgi:dienelactone hydrolase
VLVAALLCAAALPIAPARAAGHGSLYSGPAPRPGPDILYAAPAKAPQLENVGVWRAPPILVSGTSAYRDGEFLYQDFLYDDHGARGGERDRNDPRASTGTDRSPPTFPVPGDAFSAPNGTYTYPTSGGYAGNAADLVELRVKPLAHATAIRVTLNTLKNPALVAFTIAIGRSASPRALPYGADVSTPAAMFLTVHGTHGSLIDASTRKPLGPRPRVRVDILRRQFDVRVPHAAWDPGRKRVRLSGGVGLWDRSNGRYLLPGHDADAGHPGGAGTLARPEALFNVAFRYQEPMPRIADLQGDLADPSWWRDHDQGHALAAGTLAPFYSYVDFRKLRAKKNDEMTGRRGGVPATGSMDRIVASHFETAQGTDYRKVCDDTIPDENRCQGELRGRLQPYAIYVPAKPAPAAGYGLTFVAHSHAANHNEFEGSRNESQLGDRGSGSIVLTPEGRGLDGWSWDYAAADLFEVWADVARHYRLNPDATAMTGYSMGGYSTFKLSEQYPDLFARAQTTVGMPAVGVWAPPSAPTGGTFTNTNRQLASLRNVPFLMWVAAGDQFVPYAGVQAQRASLDALGYRYEFDSFAPAEHLTFAYDDEWLPAASFLGAAEVDRNPPHVTYVLNPRMEHALTDGSADHAYWLSALRVRDPGGAAPLGTIDARSEGFGVGDPRPSGTRASSGVLAGGNVGPLPYQALSQDWSAPPDQPASDTLDIDAGNVAHAAVNLQRARLDCDVTLHVRSDGPLAVALGGCDAVARFKGPGESRGVCSDRVAPRTSLSMEKKPGRARRVIVRGRSRDSGCVSRSQASRHGRVTRVSISMARVDGGRCRFLTPRRVLGAPRACRRPVRVPVRGAMQWALETRGSLLPGRYRVVARAVDASGNSEPVRSGHNRVMLRVR